MPRPSFDPTTGWWSIRVKLADGSRKKYSLMRHPGYRVPGKGEKGKRPREPMELAGLARKYTDMAMAARHGAEVADFRPQAVAEFLAEYQVGHAQDRRPNSVRILRQAVGHFLEFCGADGVEMVPGVTRDVCERYMRRRLSQGAKRSTVHVERGCLAAAWNRAVRNKRLSDNPWKFLKTPGKPANGKTDFWTEDELRRLVSAADGWVHDLIVIAANTGGRIGGILKLRWRDVDLRRKTVRYDIKTRPYEVPLNDMAVAAFESRRAESRSDLVFAPARGSGLRQASTAYKAIREAVRRAGIPEKGSYNHILRHTFASHAIMQGKSLVTVSRWLGHSNIQMTMRYAHLSVGESHRQMESFSLGGPSPTPGPRES